MYCRISYYEEFKNTSEVIQSTSVYMTCKIKFNIITTYMVIFQNKYIYIIDLFIYYTINVISLIYYRISLKFGTDITESQFQKLLIFLSLSSFSLCLSTDGILKA